MLLWWGYATGIAAILGLAAHASERIAWRRRTPARGIWAAALVASGIVPLFARLQPLPAPFPAVSRAIATSPWLLPRDAMLAIDRQLPALSAWLPWVWLLVSLGVLVGAAVSQQSMLAAARRSATAHIMGVPVHVAANEGPAVFGVLRPRIVMPSWIVVAPVHERRLALVHELNHLRAGDLPLIWGCFVFACAMPWNLAAWWLFGRLRQAVEIDCDRRVLARHADARAYGLLLVRAATARSRFALAPGLSARQSLLRRRIEHLGRAEHPSQGGCWLLSASVAACLGAAVTLPAPEPASLGHFFRAVESRPSAAPGGEPETGQATGVYRLREVPGGTVRATRKSPGVGSEPAATQRSRSELRELGAAGDSQTPGRGGRLTRAGPGG